MKKVRNGLINNLRYLCLIGVIALGLMTIVGTGGGGGGGGGSTSTSSTGEYRGTYVNIDDASDTGSWSMTFTQNGSSVSGTVTDSDGDTESFTGSITGDTLTIQNTDITATLTISGNDLTGTTYESGGDTYNVTGSLYSGIAIGPQTESSPLIGGTPVDDNAPLPTDDDDAPIISNLTVTPDNAYPGDQIIIGLTFEDNDANVITFGIQFLSETTYYTYDVSSTTSGYEAFNLTVTDTVGDVPPGSYQIVAFLVDESGNVSNHLYATLTVNGTSALDKIIVQEYWVLGDGNVYNFNNGGQLSVSTSTFSPYITENVFKITMTRNGVTKTTLYQDFSTSGFLNHYAEIWESGCYGIVTSRSALLTKEMEIGKTYHFTYVMDCYDPYDNYYGKETDQFAVTVTGPELVTTPAGSFTVYKLGMFNSWYDTTGDSGSSTGYYWFAQNIGYIKFQDSDGEIFELQSATVNGVNY
jgi:hypothetical protein